MKWTTTDKPESLPLTWAQLRTHCRIDDVSERDYVLDLAAECVAHAERLMECSLMARTITATYWSSDCGVLALPRGPVISITSVTDANDEDVEYEQSTVGNSDRICLTSITQYPVAVVYRAGHEDADDIDADILGAIKVHVATRYSLREAVYSGSIATVTNLDEFYRYRGRGVPVA